MTLSLALLLAASTGCSSPFDALHAPTDRVGGIPSSITVVSSVPTLAVGESTKLSATVMDAAGTVLADAPVTWSVADAHIASVTTDGTVVALSSGTTDVVAASGTAKGHWPITVKPPTTPGTTPPATPPPSGAPSPATLPQLYDTPMPPAPAAGGTVIPVGATDDLQAAIDRANPGDVIELAAGAVFTGNYVLRAKPGNSTSWIVIRPANAAALGAEGIRMTPGRAAAANSPRIQTANNSPAIETEPSAHHYRLVGLEITSVSSIGTTALVALGTDDVGGQTTLAVVPHDLVLDRIYMHGSSTMRVRRGVALNSASSAVIDSYISDCHEQGADSQAIMGWNGPGPYKIVNNYLEAAGEIIMFGGSDPGIPNLVPSDIEVRHNHLTRPLTWKGSAWLIKNLFELKNASRVLVEGNVMENNWMAAQDGTAIVLKSTDQSGTCTWCGTSNVTFRLNIVRNIGAAFNLAAHPETYPVDPMHTVAVSDNVISNVNVGEFNGSARVFLTQGGIADLSIRHNTVYNETVPYGALVLMGTSTDQLVRFNFSDNLTASASNWGVFSDVGVGTAAMTAYAPGGTLTNNVFAGNNGAGYPSSNFFVPDVSGVGFANPVAGDFSLVVSSPFKGKASDGKDPGADISAVLTATNGVVLP